LLLLLLLFAVPPCTKREPRDTPEAPTPFVQRDGHTYAVVELLDWCVEGSNLGGTHWWFRVVGTEQLLHGGGHGLFADYDLLWFDGHTLADVPMQRRYFVAKVVLGSPRRGVIDWCAEGPEYTGDILELGLANGLADARLRVVEAARMGMLADPIEIYEGMRAPKLKMVPDR
jgi:hypothetical protein